MKCSSAYTFCCHPVDHAGATNGELGRLFACFYFDSYDVAAPFLVKRVFVLGGLEEAAINASAIRLGREREKTPPGISLIVLAVSVERCKFTMDAAGETGLGCRAC